MATNKYSKVQAPKQVKGYTVNAIVDDVPMNIYLLPLLFTLF